MKSKLKYLGFLFLILLQGCNSGFGNKMTNGEIDIYYSDKKLADIADSLGMFWKKNGLVGTRKQSLKISEGEKFYQLYLIQTKGIDNSLTLDDQLLLEELKYQLDSAVFKTKPVQLISCNEKFEPIQTLTR